MYHPALRPYRRWPVFAMLGGVAALAVVWCGFWFYAASRAQTAMAGWRAREAKIGRVYQCADESVGGFPFRIEVRCSKPAAEWRSSQPPFSLTARDLLVAAQIYQPTLLISEIQGPLYAGPPGRPPTVMANWKLAQASVRGSPRNPQRVALVFDDARFERATAPVAELMLAARHIELHGRMLSGSAQADPVIELALGLDGATAPMLLQFTRRPVDVDLRGTLRGLKDFSAKPWPARLRELQARGGTLEVTSARLQQGDVLAVGHGTLGLSQNGRLDGTLDVTVAGLDKLLPALGIDPADAAASAATGGKPDKLSTALGRLDELVPGLGKLARKNAGPMLQAGLALIGKPAELEGRQATRLPLRFADGEVFLGPIRVGQTPPLY